MTPRHFIRLLDFETDDIVRLLEVAEQLKRDAASKDSLPLRGQLLALVFEKPSLRTRLSFQSAMAQLGGMSVFMTGDEAALGVRESVADFAQTISQYVNAVVVRTRSQETVETFARHAQVPVINGLSDRYHPCQAVGDLFTMREVLGSLEGRTLAFVGDGNNVARSLAVCCALLGVRFVLASPAKYGFDRGFLREYDARFPGHPVTQVRSAVEAVEKADVIYTDVWTSMGQEAERATRRRAFASYQVNDALLRHAPPHCRVMHCLPARRGEEITSEVLDSDRSIVYQQAGNRLHVQKALLLWLFGELPRSKKARPLVGSNARSGATKPRRTSRSRVPAKAASSSRRRASR